MAVPTLAKFGEWGIDLLPHPPYSPDLAPCDFALFPKMKERLRGTKHRTLVNLKQAVKDTLNSFDRSFFESCFADLVTRWKKCVACEGDYFEGEHVQIQMENFDMMSESENSESDDE